MKVSFTINNDLYSNILVDIENIFNLFIFIAIIFLENILQIFNFLQNKRTLYHIHT